MKRDHASCQVRVERRLGVAAVLMAATAGASGQNLVVNGNFEQGNVGFQSDYSFSSGGNCCEGQYTVRGNGSTFNGAFVNPPPSSPGSVQMMVVNGSTVSNQRIWYQTIAVTPGVTYAFTLRGCTAVAGGPAVLQWQVNGSLIGNPTSLPSIIMTPLSSKLGSMDSSGAVSLATAATGRLPKVVAAVWLGCRVTL